MNNNSPFLLNEYELSNWAYRYCKNIKDDPKIRKIITKQIFFYLYCRYIKDRSEMRNNITDSHVAFLYCLNVKNDPEIRKLIEWEKFHE